MKNEDPIIKYPNGVLRQKCKQVLEITNEVKDFTQHLLILCRRREAFGLAAPQVGHLLNIVVVDPKHCPLVKEFGFDPGDCSPNPIKKEYMRETHSYLINPIISNIGSNTHTFKEACLSLPGVAGRVTRPSSFDVTFQSIDGKTYIERIEDTSKDLYGIIVQHEIDHLEGKLFIDRMQSYDASKLIGRINKLRRK
jgi:peptide deformylase